MALHLLLVYVLNLLNLLSETIANPVAPKRYIGGIGTVSLDHQKLDGRSAKQDTIYSDILTARDLSVFGDNSDMLSTKFEASGYDIALLDREVFSIDQDNPQPDSYDENIERLAGEDPGNLDQILEFSGGDSEVVTSCQQEDNLDYFITDSSMLTSRNLIDEYFDLRIPEGILAPNQLCPGPLNENEIPTTRQPTENERLPFPFPLPDYDSTRCRVGLGEIPLYALCCYMPDGEFDSSEGNACYPGEIHFFFSVSSLFSACVSQSGIFFINPSVRFSRLFFFFFFASLDHHFWLNIAFVTALNLVIIFLVLGYYFTVTK